MKETYFTTDSLESKAQQLLSNAILAPRRRRGQLMPARSALLVLDMQGYFLESSSHACVPSARAIIPGIRKLILEYTSRELPVFFTRHQNTLDDAGQMAHWWKDLLSPEHPLSGITPELPVDGGLVIRKTQYDAFFNTHLEEELKAREVSQVLICGVMAHLCCETTARSAFMRGFEVFFLVDGTATYTERIHLASLINLSHGFASLVLIGDILKNLGVSERH